MKRHDELIARGTVRPAAQNLTADQWDEYTHIEIPDGVDRADITLMPAEDFDALSASLDVAEDVPALARLSECERRFIR